MLIKLVTLTALIGLGQSAAICDRKPKGATGAAKIIGNRYHIVIASNPETYNPTQQYKVIIESQSRIGQQPSSFNGFTLSVEPVKRQSDATIPQGPLSAGVFKIIPEDVNTKIDENCPNTVVHSSHVFLLKVEVWWIAPDPGTGCVIFKAAVMEQNVWYQNDRGLTLKLCENQDAEIPDLQETCCSCNEAKYEMKFEGLWTRQSHPLHFPQNMWLTRFSDVIGASHATDYRIWKVNTNASSGLIEFSENENTTILESEIKSTNRTRTIIKAKGIAYPNITGKTFAVFRVDQQHHLLSLISLIKPSPDWFVGLSGYELCDSNCTWISERKIDLHPYDLGIWEDMQYESRTNRTDDLIRKIDHSNNPDSPFYTDSTEKLKPMARVHLIKSREYERNENCLKEEENKPTEEISTEPNASITPQDDITEEEKLKECTRAKYGPWTNCTMDECDPERVMVQFRQLDKNTREYCLENNITIMNEQPCRVVNCAKAKYQVPTPNMCPMEPWKPFSDCDTNCKRERSRKLLRAEDKFKYTCIRVVTKQQLPCSPEECIELRKNR